MPEPVLYQNKETQSGTRTLRYWTEMMNSGMPMPAASASMPMPSYAQKPNTVMEWPRSIKASPYNVNNFRILTFTPPPPSGFIIHTSIEEGKVLIKNFAFFFPCPSKQFLPISFQIQLLEYFPQKQKEQRHKNPGYTDKLFTTQI